MSALIRTKVPTCSQLAKFSTHNFVSKKLESIYSPTPAKLDIATKKTKVYLKEMGRFLAFKCEFNLR